MQVQRTSLWPEVEDFVGDLKDGRAVSLPVLCDIACAAWMEWTKLVKGIRLGTTFIIPLEADVAEVDNAVSTIPGT